MPAIITSNSRVGEKSPDVPFKDNGNFFNYLMYFDNNRKIAYADDPADLLELLIPGYTSMNEEERLDARLSKSINLQAVTQAQILLNLTKEDKDNLKDWELKVLRGEYNEEQSYMIRDFWKETLPEGTNPEDVPENDRMDIWSSEIPLVLIDAAYKPWSNVEPPLGNPDGTNTIWLQPVDEVEFLESLSLINYIAFGMKRNN